MAKLDVITIQGKQSVCFNLSKSVGTGGMNEIGDVMLIKALFLYNAMIYGFSGLGVGELRESPLNGVFDGAIANVISRYQQNNASQLLKADGLIHPASYKNRNLKDITKPLMMITRLHLDATTAALLHAHQNYTIGMIRTMPSLLPVVGMGTFFPAKTIN